MRNAFADCHPLVNFSFFALVLGFTMVLMHPASILVSFLSALALVRSLCPRGTLRRSLPWLLPTMLISALVNPAFNHEGATVLAYFPSGNPLTLESILYGFAAAMMLGAVLLWCACASSVLGAEKFVYLFGRIIPSLGLVLSMTLRFVPRLKRQFHAVTAARQGLYGEEKPFRRAVSAFSAVLTWSLESAVQTADSMKGRGYGLSNRSAYTLYRLDGRDGAVLAAFAALGFALFCGSVGGAMDFHWFPLVSGGFYWPLHAAYAALCLTPAILNGWGEKRWKRLQSEI